MEEIEERSGGCGWQIEVGGWIGGSALVGWRRKSRERVGENLDREEIPRWKRSGGGRDKPPRF